MSDVDFRRLVEALEDCALILLDASGCVRSWNRGAERLKGYRAEEILGRHFFAFYARQAVAVGHPDSELDIAAMTGRYREEGWRQRKDGTLFWAGVTIVALRGGNGDLEGFAKYTQDLTSRLQAEQQIANTLSLLHQAARN